MFSFSVFSFYVLPLDACCTCKEFFCPSKMVITNEKWLSRDELMRKEIVIK
uniref:Uncharacterized protein n=1 Tax=Nelumbo nucifera TaxID=4432 RepID=A0A822Y8Q9_NELNU|nr:TPA_asm: hypothetical protein HUJ06_009295 [Nelumbo nucifera]